MTNQRTKNVIVTVICVLLMLFFVLSAILYAEGYYDFSFIRRTVIETEPPETEAPETEPSAPTHDPSEGEVLAGIPLLSSMVEYRPTGTIYQKGKTLLARIEIAGTGKGTSLFSGTKPAYELSVTEEKSGKKVYTYIPAEGARRTVEVYMGYFIVKDGEGLSYYNAYGNAVIRNYTGPEPEPAYGRDGAGRALFLIDGGYYYIDDMGGAFAPADVSEEDLFGVAYEFTTDAGGVSVFRSGSSWGYRDASGKTILSGYARAYPFSEGRGFAENGESSAYVNEEGKLIVNGLTPVGREREIIAAGTVYFDNGHVIVRRVAYNRAGQCTEDREFLIGLDGKEVPLPVGCTLVSYSNGRILLERDGKYGFYAVKGDWIADTEYTYAAPFAGGLAVIGRADGKKAVIDMDGNIVLDFFYTDIEISAGGTVAAWSEETGYALFVKATR